MGKLIVQGGNLALANIGQAIDTPSIYQGRINKITAVALNRMRSGTWILPNFFRLNTMLQAFYLKKLN